MDTTDKAVNSAYEAFDRNKQAAETLGQKEVHLKNTEQQLLKHCRNYVQNNPWVTQ